MVTTVESDESKSRTLVVADCGYLGAEIARQARGDGWLVIGICRGEDSAQQTKRDLGIDVRVADLSDAESLRNVAGGISKSPVVIHCASTKGGDADAYREVYVSGAENLLAAFSPERLVFVSSTSVFGQTDGSEVDEESEVDPASPTGAVLLEAEGVTRHADGIVARLGGIYGPSRSILLRKFIEGSATIDEGVERVINQIHRDDAASAVLHLLNDEVSGVFNVVDSEPQRQPDLMRWLASSFNREVPLTAPRKLGKRRGWTNKSVSNKKLRASGWSPRYASFREAVKNDPRLIPSILSQLENA